MINYKYIKVKGLFLLFMVTLIPLMFGLLLISSEDSNNSVDKELSHEDSNLKLSLPPTTYDWWNTSWDFRVPIGITAVGDQQDAPVELFINFTKYFEDLSIQQPILNVSTIRVIEYNSSSDYYEVDCQFDPYSRSYNNQTNAIGDLIWILNGTTLNSQTRDFFVYFNNGTNYDISAPNYDTIRLWHEGFEEYQSGDILRPTDGQDNYHPTYWEISNTTSARGSSSLRIWGNCWKISATGSITVNADTRVTAKMRFDDPGIQREISGLGFDTTPNNIPTSGNSYRIRGSQSWGTAGSNKYVNQYYAANTFFWYTFIPSTEFSLNPFTHIVYIADDDSWTNLDLYWDDISIWNKQVQTTPNNYLQTELGDIQPQTYALKITCKDEDGNLVPTAQINLTNDLYPSYNQNHESDENGEWTFEDIEKDALYNITVNYTQNGLSNPKIATVFYYEDFPITELNNELTAFLNLTKLNFDVIDRDNDPIQFGFVMLKEGTDNVGKAVLSDSGTCSITWINDTAYDYEVYFDYDSLVDNSKYIYSSLLINSSSVGADKDISVTTEFTKITFNVTDDTAEKVPFTNAKLRFYNTSDYDNENLIIANVTVDINGLASFICFSNSTLNWGNYTVDLYFGGGERDFLVNILPLDHEYNFSLDTETQASIRVPMNYENYNSTIEIIQITSSVIWGEDANVLFNFIKRDEPLPNPVNVTPNELYLQILDEELTEYSQKIDILSSEISEGVFNYTFNTQSFNLIGGNTYYIEITGNYKSYMFNAITPSQIKIQSKSTSITYYNYTLNELVDKRFSVIYGEKVNITVDYFDTDTGNSLDNALITYDWDFDSGMLNDDPIHADLYFFEFDSSTAPNDAEYIIDIIATLSNYSTITDSLIVNIRSRPTLINGTTTLFQFSPKIYVLESVNYTFEYRDVLLDNLIENLDIASYNWYKLDEEGNPLSGPGNEGSGNLIGTVDNRYILDFETELKEVGEYSLFITMQKKNYEVRNAFISLTIEKRPISLELSATGLSGNKISIVQGDKIDFRIVLTDPTNGSQLLRGAIVTLNIEGNIITLNETSTGIYEYTYSTSHINTFIMPKTLTGQIIIEKENYEIDPRNITIIVGMTEIFPGFPMFYFLLIVGGIIAIGGSLVTYWFIQMRRIPTFVKKVRAMKKSIKGKKDISDSLLYPSKEEYIVKKLGDKWESIGLSLSDIIGVKEKMKKKLPEVEKEFKGGTA